MKGIILTKINEIKQICIYTTQKKLRILNILNLFMQLVYAICARIAYVNHTKKLRYLIV